MALDLHSELFAPTGGIAGEGAVKTLGRPRLTPLEVLIREATQNALDARSSAEDPVRFGVHVRRLARPQLRCLRETVFANLPEHACGELTDALQSPLLDVVVLWDRGTVGLAGPTRMDQRIRKGDSRRFVDFFRNIGRVSTAVKGGGTYGFGKSSLYAYSAVSTIIVHSRVRNGRSFESRMMAASIGPQFTRRVGRRLESYTGRHWWGVLEDGEVADPLTGAEADRLAKRLGMPAFETGETGTTIMVLAPRIDADDIDSAAARRAAAEGMRDTAMGYCWPHLLTGETGGMQLEVYADNEEIVVGAVADHPVLRFFTRAYRAASTGSTPKGTAAAASGLMVFDIECHNPQRLLGRLAISRVRPPRGRQVQRDSESRQTSLPENPLAHIALMRAPRLVVRYAKAPVMPETEGLVGVFVAEEDLNEAFAESEPVTHDEWNPENLPRGHDRTFVRVALKRIQEVVNKYVSPLPLQGSGSGEDQVPLGAVARSLATLIPDLKGDGSHVRDMRPPDTGPARGERKSDSTPGAHVGRIAELVGRPQLSAGVDGAVARFRLRYASGSATASQLLRCHPRVLAADGSKEREAPIGAGFPKIIGWFKDGQALEGSTPSTLLVQPQEQGECDVMVSVPDGAAVSVSFTFETAEL